MKVNHKDRDHALLGASSSKRWSTCPLSIILNELLPDEGESPFAKEGTEAHEWSEKLLRLLLKDEKEEFENLSKELEALNPDMHYYVNKYLDECMDLLDSSKLVDNPVAIVEAVLDFDKYVPEGFGTVDFLIMRKGYLAIRDLKYGKGVRVSIKDNPQLRLYALGAVQTYDETYNFQKFDLGIIQPRLGSYENEMLTRSELLSWYEKDIQKQALDAYFGLGNYRTGECKFCKAKALCKFRANDLLDSIKKILKGV